MTLKLKHLIVLPGLVVALVLALSGCGKKGPLTLPDKAAQNAHISPSPLPSPIKDERV
jgi:predicted small lipoprotein YifL